MPVDIFHRHTLYDLPMPPSENAIYRVFNNRLVRSKVLDVYRKEMKFWANRNYKHVQHVRNDVVKWGKYTYVEAYICFRYNRCFNKKGEPKKIDGSNRVKALHDCLADILDCDDKFFWGSSVEKVPLVQGDDIERCVVRIGLAHMYSITDIEG